MPLHPALESIIGHATAGAGEVSSNSLAEDFGRRLDAHTAGLANDKAREAFLSGQLLRWIALYNLFVQKVEAGNYIEPTGADHVDASDYVATISAIDTRLTRVRRGLACGNE